MCRTLYFLALVFALLLNTGTASAQSNYTTTDFFVPNGTLRLQVRKIVETTYSSRRKLPLLLIHGGTGATTSFDLGTEDASFAKSLALSGFTVYLMNIRGWERSTAPTYNLTDTALVAGSCLEAASDINAVVNYVLQGNPKGKINLFGWAVGGHWAAYYTTLHNDKVANLIVLNSLYSVKAPWLFNTSFASSTDSTRFDNSIPAYRQSNEQAVINIWKTGLTDADTTIKADSAVIKAFAKSAVGFNDEHLLKTPGGFRKESFYMASGRKYWDAKDITVPTLIIRGDRDFWSRPIDADTFYNELISAPNKKKFIIANGNHFVFLDTQGNGRRKLLIAINNFVKKGL
ncbi:alpha/beta fold hydrolase [Mucilaginibacter gilvus]|uniref:Alpha/beta fold hydrolase n=1 Tax=Mucilaginibacter gilvus TaxID=2305909 RepID=A0A3S3UVN7_9SPHI|nr:alpha/beta fold hydrolase [Mucilaginibacter gilvus]RWY55567.1 alpha/beta fold hydrolase [Mucilaginibacter gilvus]